MSTRDVTVPPTNRRSAPMDCGEFDNLPGAVVRLRHGVYVSRVSWKRRYPDQGRDTYRVRLLLDGTKIGKTITFKR